MGSLIAALVFCPIGVAYNGLALFDPAILPALTMHGMADLAEKIFLNRKVPGWLYQVDRGATSIWERWDALGEDGTIYDPDMNSYNHYAYGAVCQWLFEDVAGLKLTPEGAGFSTLELDPAILPALSPVKAWHDVRQGRIEAEWSLVGDQVTYRVVLPQGVDASLKASSIRSNVSVNGQSVESQTDISLKAGEQIITFSI